MTTDRDDDTPLAGHFRGGVTAEDLPALFPLLRARKALEAFITLFRGGDDDVLVRLLVLREIGARGEEPRWSPQDLRAHFAYLDQVKLDTVLHRLRDNGLLVWDGETGFYQVSPAGRMALAAIATLLKFAGDEGAELGYITAQLAASQAVGRVSSEELQHLLSRLNELQDEFNRAVLSGSEHRIRQAESKLNSVWHWVEKGTEVMRTIAADADLDAAAHRVAQRIGQVQSRMLRMSAVFQRTLNQLEGQRVHLGASGLSSSDITVWLRMKGVDEIASLLADGVHSTPQPGFVLGDIAMDMAEFELVDRDRPEAQDETLPPAAEAPVTAEVLTEEEDLSFLEDWLGELRTIVGPEAVEERVPAEGFELSAYRLSLLSLLGDPESRAVEGPVADLARSGLLLELSGESVRVGRAGVAEMSTGRLAPDTRSAPEGPES